MMRGGDALSVGGGGAVVEVGGVTMSHLSSRAQADLLLLLGPGGSDADHPDQEDEEDQEDDGSGDAYNVKKHKTVDHLIFCNAICSPPAM